MVTKVAGWHALEEGAMTAVAELCTPNMFMLHVSYIQLNTASL